MGIASSFAPLVSLLDSRGVLVCSTAIPQVAISVNDKQI
jgi:hypothetical protein